MKHFKFSIFKQLQCPLVVIINQFKKMKFTISVLSIVLFIGFTSCNQNNKQSKEKNVTEARVVKKHFTNRGGILKVLQTSNYTYVLVKNNTDTNWLAIIKMPVKAGQILYYNTGFDMKNFHSKELSRTFAVVSFVQEASISPTFSVPAGNQPEKQTIKPKTIRENINIKPVSGGISIAELYAHKDRYSGKIVKVRGKVTVFNTNIMGKNWAHIQDGTSNDDNFDLTVTTQNQVHLGDVVTFEGKITLNKNLGAVYFYPVIMEDAKVIK